MQHLHTVFIVGSSPTIATNGDCRSMVDPWVVIPVAVGSSPISHPTLVLVVKWIITQRYGRCIQGSNPCKGANNLFVSCLSVDIYCFTRESNESIF